MFTQKRLRVALTFAQTQNPKITNEYPIKTLELFQNNDTSAQCLLGEHGPWTRIWSEVFRKFGSVETRLKDVNHELKTFCACRAYVTEDKLSGFFNSLFIFIAIHLTSGASIIYCTNITVLTTCITILYYNYIHQKSKLQKNMWDKCNLHTDL